MKQLVYKSSQKQKLSLLFKCMVGIILVVGILFRSGIVGGESQLHILYSFTSTSNVCILVLTLLTCFQILREQPISKNIYRARTIGLTLILLTGIIYHFIILPEKRIQDPNYSILTIGNIITYYVVPTLLMIDWCIFDQKGSLKKKDPIIILAFPTLYFIVISLYDYVSSVFLGRKTSPAYLFMDFDTLGVSGVLARCGSILAGLVTLVYGIYFLDKKLGKQKVLHTLS